ncbi:MAG: hypothetical protein MCM46_16485 [Candidatus Manganitrophus sp. SB1]|nr:hypothetical protein [Candidatus Manganitrophus morganii]
MADETLLKLRLLKEGVLDWCIPAAYRKLFVEQAEKLTDITKLQVSKWRRRGESESSSDDGPRR